MHGNATWVTLHNCTKGSILEKEFMNTIDRQSQYFWLSAIIVVAVATRLFTLGGADIVLDEFFTALYYEERAHSIVNPLIYILIRMSQSIFGESEFALRLPTFVFGVGAIPLIYLLGRELRSTSVGLLCAAFLTLLPWHLWHSQYARYYAAVIFFTILMHLFFIRALRRDSIAYLLSGGAAALLAASAHVTAVLAPFSGWIVFAVLYFYRPRFGDDLSWRIIRIGFWAGILSALAIMPLLFSVLLGWTGSVLGWSRSAAQLIVEYYREAGILILFACYSLWILRKSKQHFTLTYLSITMIVPIAIAIGAALFIKIRGDYGICFLVPAIVAAAIAVDFVWQSPRYGRELSVLLVLVILADASPRLASHYIDRLARYSLNATEFLLEQHRPGDRVAVFVPGVHYYLLDKVNNIERAGVGNPNMAKLPWPRTSLEPTNEERLWLVFRVARDDVSPAVRRWLRANEAIMVWRQVSPRLDSQVRGVEIFLVCPRTVTDCDHQSASTLP
jgi:hypothetical protein